jgi:hypothetical protein
MCVPGPATDALKLEVPGICLGPEKAPPTGNPVKLAVGASRQYQDLSHYIILPEVH